LSCILQTDKKEKQNCCGACLTVFGPSCQEQGLTKEKQHVCDDNHCICFLSNIVQKQQQQQQQQQHYSKVKA